MKATDFNLSKDLEFNVESGITVFKGNRLVIFDAGALGLLRQKIYELLGWEKTRELFLKFGFQNGYADFMQMKLSYKFETETDLLASGPVIHSWEGIVSAKPTEIEFNRDKGEMYFKGIWKNSYEAEQHLMFNEVAREPVCWSLMGYASGWISGFLGTKVIAIEPVCAGKGDDHCEWFAQHLAAWDQELIKPYKEAYEEFVIGGR